MRSKIEEAFFNLSRTEKVTFISKNIQYASDAAVAGRIESYLFDVLKEIKDDEYVADYLRQKGYEVVKKR